MANERSWAEEVTAQGEVPLTWVHSTETFQVANLGDALSAVIVAGLSGLAIKPAGFRSSSERLAAIGTIAHSFVGGTIHLWGTGIDRRINVLQPSSGQYKLPDDTRIVANAVRGPFTRRTLVQEGVVVPEVYGDAAWFLPRFYNPVVPKLYDVGVVMHISELSAPSPGAGAKPEYLRYVSTNGGPSVKLINTYHEPDVGSLCNKMDEILSCKRIASTSFHGLMLAERYNIPCCYFGLRHGTEAIFDPEIDFERIDHRVADFYAGAKAKRVLTYNQPRVQLTDWERLIRFIDAEWSALELDSAPLLNAFPLPLNPLQSLEQLSDLKL